MVDLVDEKLPPVFLGTMHHARCRTLSVGEFRTDEGLTRPTLPRVLTIDALSRLARGICSR